MLNHLPACAKMAITALALQVALDLVFAQMQMGGRRKYD